jgi:uncharacterized protein (TIGR03083 family)
MDYLPYQQAVASFIDVLEHVQPGQWETPALGEWSVRELAGHTLRSLAVVPEFAATTAEEVAVDSPAAYYRAALSAPGINQQVAERGHAAGAALGPDPLAVVRPATERALAALAGVADDARWTVNVGGMRAADYMPSRVLELTVHTLDLAQAIGYPIQPGRDALGVVLHLLAELAVDSPHAGALALVATGRRVPGSFTVLG